MFQRLRRFLWTNSRRQLTWRWILVFLAAAHVYRFVVVIIYCLVLHNCFFRFTSCPTERSFPKNFTDIGEIRFAIEPIKCLDNNFDDRGDQSSTIRLVLFVPVHVTRFRRRETIRRTWGRAFVDASNSDANDVDGSRRRITRRLRTKLVFVIGSLPPDDQDEKGVEISYRLREESKQNDDILQVADVIDSYYNITLKIRSVLTWATTRCGRTSYVIRADSDVVLDYANLLRFLFWRNGIDSDSDFTSIRSNAGATTAANLSSSAIAAHRGGGDGEMMIAGFCRPHDCVTRWPTSKTCLPRSVYDILGDASTLSAYFVPRYCFGFSYVLSTPFVERALRIWSQDETVLANVSPAMRTILARYWPLDDVYVTGYVAEAMADRAPRRYNYPRAFNYRVKFDAYSCNDRSMVASSAYDDDDEMRRRWRARVESCSTAEEIVE